MNCHAGKDGDCIWEHCPQLRDNEPTATGRHCPLDLQQEETGSVDHSEHGRADPKYPDEPADSGCACTGTDDEPTCSLHGCGFCLASLKMKIDKSKQ